MNLNLNLYLNRSGYKKTCGAGPACQLCIEYKYDQKTLQNSSSCDCHATQTLWSVSFIRPRHSHLLSKKAPEGLSAKPVKIRSKCARYWLTPRAISFFYRQCSSKLPNSDGSRYWPTLWLAKLIWTFPRKLYNHSEFGIEMLANDVFVREFLH